MKLSTALILWLAVQTECIRMRVKMNNSNITAHGMFPVEAQAMWRKKRLERTSGCERAFILFLDACWTEARKIPSDRADVRARWQSLVDRRVPSERRKIAKRSIAQLMTVSTFTSCSDMVSTFSSGKRDDDFRNPLDNVAIPIGTTTTACSEPSGWTGRMNKAPGFHPFLKDNQHICILHHGDKDRSAARQQASIFGVAMEEAKCLEACDKNIQKAAWNIGSRAYAKYHTAARYFPIFVGPNFGIGRAGKNTVLYMHELGSILRHHRSNKLRLEFMNFSPIDCSGLRETPISFLHSDFGRQPSCTLNEAFRGQCRHVGHVVSIKLDMSCINCNVANSSAGPSKEEIAACYARIRRQRGVQSDVHRETGNHGGVTFTRIGR